MTGVAGKNQEGELKRPFAFILCLVLAFAIFASCGKAELTLSIAEMLELGERYLLELNYEQALVQFLRVIEVEPMNQRGYTGAAEAYIGLGRVDDAEAVLRQGLRELPENASITTVLERLEAEPSINASPAANNPTENNPTENNPTENNPAEPGPEPHDDIPYYDTLSDGQKRLLSQLEAATRSIDYQAAYGIMGLSEFQAICDAIPGGGVFWYYPDDVTSIEVKYTVWDGNIGYHMDIYEGSNGEGRYISSRYGGSDPSYALHVVGYSGGKANGPFINYISIFGQDSTGFFTTQGTLQDGKGTGTVIYTILGQETERDHSGYYDWWPDWPEGR